MSLIHDALARAREEAARREALARGETPAATPPPEHYRFRSPLWTLALVVVVVLAGGATLGRWLTARSHGSGGDAATPASRAAEDRSPRPELSATLPVDSGGPGTAAASGTSPSPAAPVGEGSPTPSAVLETGAAGLPPAPVRPNGSATGTQHPPGNDSGGSVALGSASSADLGGGRSLELQGVVWNTRSPSAVINGTLMEPGDSVEGFELVRIEPRVAVLSDGRREITLSLGPGGG